MDKGDWRQGAVVGNTLQVLMDRYLAEVSPLKRSASDQFHFRQIGRHPIATFEVKRLTAEAVVSFRDSRLKQVSPATVRKEMNLISQVLRHATSEWGLCLAVNPVAQVKKPAAPKGRERRISDEEANALLLAFRKTRNPLVKQVFLFAIATGMRRGEILSLTWEQVDIEKRTAHLPMTKNGEARTVPLSPAALGLLSERKTHEGGHVFPITRNALRLSWDRLRARAKVEDLRFHDLRHEAISRFFEFGLSVPEVALISGHKDVKMLFRYTHLKPDAVAEKLHEVTASPVKAPEKTTPA